MTRKTADLNKTLYELTAEHPELIDILFELGFAGVKNPVMRESLGRLTTVKAGCGRLGMDPAQVAETLRSKGFTVKE